MAKKCLSTHLEPEQYARAVLLADALGFASASEFIAGLIKKEIEAQEKKHDALNHIFNDRLVVVSSFNSSQRSRANFDNHSLLVSSAKFSREETFH